MCRLQALLIALLCVAAFATVVCADTVGVRFNEGDRLVIVQRTVPAGMAPAEAAIRALVAGPTQAEIAMGYSSSIPAGTTVGKVTITADTAEVDMSQAVLVGLDEAILTGIFDQFKATLGDFPSITSIRLTCSDELLSSYLAPGPAVGEAAPALVRTNAVGLSGKKICVGPSHGRFWNGSGWYWQRSDPCAFGEAVLEDTNSVRLIQFLKQYLVQDGATFTSPRQLDESDCCHDTIGYPWWKMCAQSWLRHAGLPCSVWANSSGNCGSDTATSRSSDDIRARPKYADYVGSDIYIAHHTNAGGSGTATGTETFRDTAMEYPAHETNSYNLAVAVQNSIINTIRSTFPEEPSWANRGVKDSAGGFGEIRVPNRPAILIELAFHDDCTRDASYLTDDFFRSISEWAVYKGICDYFGNTPTWDKYSGEYVSDTIPTTMNAGQSYNVSVTFRNRGISWFTSRGFRLGAVGDSDPFTASTRVNITGQVKPGQTYTFNFTLTAPGTGGTYVTDWRMVRDGYAWFGPTLTKSVTVQSGTDTQPPTVPQNLQVTGVTSSSVSLSWSASTDNFGVVGYRIYRNGTQVGTASGTTYTDNGLADNTTYSYQVDAYDGVPNYSGKSTAASGTTIAIAFQDGFADANNWVFDSSVSGNVAPTFTTAQNHGSVVGNGSLYFPAGAPHWVYHNLSASTTTGGYKTGKVTGWIYDVSGAVGGLRTALRAYLYDATGTYKTIYWVGATNGNPPNISTHYMGAVFNGSWTYFDLGSRSTAWHQLGIEILPYTGSNDLKFYLDGTPVVTTSQPAPAADAVVRRLYLGYNYNVNQDAYYDDIKFETVPPAAPTNLAGQALSSTSIRWSFVDNANNEIGGRIYSGSTKVAEREVINTTYVDESGLAPNTNYTRTAKAYAGIYESAGASGTGCTLSVAPSASNVTCDKQPNVWQTTSAFTFTAVGGFGAGLVDHYLVAWDQQSTHAWTGSEAVWSSGQLVRSATASASPWYLHIKGYNSADVANGTLDIGPFYYDGALPVISAVSVSPSMAAVGDALQVVVDASDDVDVVSVTANDIPLVKSGATWTGELLSAEPIGIKPVTVVAKDVAQKSATDTSASYKTARIVAMSTGAAWLPAVNGFYGTYLFKFAGQVTETDDNFFQLSDGSSTPVTVYAPGYKTKVQTGDYATARGILSSGGSIQSSVDYVVKHE